MVLVAGASVFEGVAVFEGASVLVAGADSVAEPVDEGGFSFVGAVVPPTVPSGDADALADALADGVPVADGVVADGEALPLGVVDELWLADGELGRVGLVGLVGGLVVWVGVGWVVGLGLWLLGVSGSGAPRFGPWTVPSTEP